jgi:Flp pilus assembly protein TadG
MNNNLSSIDFPPEETSQAPRKSRLGRRLGRRRRGAAVVELAITMPLLSLLVIGVTEFSQYVNAAQIVTNASRRGARLAARDDTVTTSEVQADVTAFLTGAFPGLSGSSSAIRVQVVDGSGTTITGDGLNTISSGSPVRVNVSLDFDSIRWLSHFSTLDSQTLQTSTVARRE